MSETRVPTMSFRWVVQSIAVLGEKETAKRLQQMFYTPAGRAFWEDVPIVAETPALATRQEQ